MTSDFSLSRLSTQFRKFGFGAIVAVIIATLISVGVFLINSYTPPSATSTFPTNGDSLVSPLATIKVVFDKPISNDNVNHFSITPVVGGKGAVKDSVFEFIPTSHLGFGQKYNVRLAAPIGSSGRSGNDVVFSFTVKTADMLDASDKASLQAKSDQNLSKNVPGPSNIDQRKAQAKYNLLSQMPYQTDQFSIEYLPDQDEFNVTIKQNPFKDNQQKAIDWFRLQGVEDLSWINIMYSSVRGVYP